MKYCCEEMEELRIMDFGIYPPGEDGEKWGLFIQGRHHYTSGEIWDIKFCPFCGKELKSGK